jgi:hypothetical protein
MKWTMAMIRAKNKEVGHNWFSRGAMEFFNSRIERGVYQGSGGIYFVSSEQFLPYDSEPKPRKYSVRQFDPETGHVNTVNSFNDMTREDAIAKAKELAK